MVIAQNKKGLHHIYLFLMCVGLLSLTITQPVAADDRALAKQVFESGVQKFESGDYAGALSEFQRAYAIKPHPVVQINIAHCYEKLDKPVEALKSFEAYLNASSAQQTEARTQEVRQAIARLRLRIGELDVRTSPPGAAVSVDGTSYTSAELQDSLTLSAGVHMIEVSRPGYITERREVKVPGGGRVKSVVALRTDNQEATTLDANNNLPAPIKEMVTPAAASASNQDNGGMRLTTPVVISGIATLALAAGALTTGLMATSANGDFDKAVQDSQNPALSAAQRNAARDAGLSAADRADSLALATDILLGAAIAGAAVTTVLFVTQAGRGQERAPAGNNGLSFSPTFLRSGAGFSLAARF